MADLIVLPCPDGWIALSRDVYAQALQDARRAGWGAKSAENAAQAVAGDAEPLLNAAQLAQALGLSRTWVEQAARDGRIPVVRAGRYVRFRRREVERALACPVPNARRLRRKEYV